jgi:hypothetical protein
MRDSKSFETSSRITNQEGQWFLGPLVVTTSMGTRKSGLLHDIPELMMIEWASIVSMN